MRDTQWREKEAIVFVTIPSIDQWNGEKYSVALDLEESLALTSVCKLYLG